MSHRLRRLWMACAAVTALLLATAGCGGGGGGGGGGGTAAPGSGPGSTQPASFLGFAFRTGPTGTAIEFTTPPLEDLQASPPQLGAPLDIVVLFKFDPTKSVPAGPFTQTTLPVYTTPAEMPPEAVPPNGAQLIPAKGTYALVGHTVEFRPFLPQDPLSITPSSPPDSIPGFIPGAVYTAKVETTPGLKIANLVGPGGLVKFQTTTVPGGYFSSAADYDAPELISSVPQDGAFGFYPGLFSNTAAGSDLPTFVPKGPETVALLFDHGVLPTAENLAGKDWNGDGLVDATFFLRTRASRLLVSHTVPADSFNLGEPAFAALSGLIENAVAPGLVVDQDGGDIVVNNSPGPFPGGTPALVSAPAALAAGADPSLTFAIYAAAGNDSLSVFDHTLGDPGFAQVAAAAVVVPLDDAVGLVTLLDGRLVAFERTGRRIVELLPQVGRDLPLGAPTLVSVQTALDPSEPAGFLSEPFAPSLDVRDLAQTPSGALYALVATAGGSQLVPLEPIDFDADGAFAPGDGLPSGAAPIVLPASGPYDAVEFLSETTALALQREDDAVDLLDLAGGGATRVVSNLAGFGKLPPGEPSPALAICVAFMNLDVGVELVDNQPTASSFVLDPATVLSPGTLVDVMQRPNLASLAGVSAANEQPDAPLYVLGARRLLTLRVALPTNVVDDCGAPDPQGRIHDVLVEEFDDSALEDPSSGSTSPLADWGGPLPGSGTSGRLTASVGVSGTAELGDFRPQPFPNFDPDSAYSSSQGAVNQANWRIIFLDTDAQNFPLSDGSTPGVITPVTVYGGKFGFRDVIIPEGVWVIARGTNPLQITATGTVEIAGLIDVSGADGLDDVTFDTGFLPVPGGAGGAGGGRGGNAQPTLWNPNFPPFLQVGTGLIAAQYVTPERAEDGQGPVIGPTGLVTFAAVGGEGGLSTAGYDANPQGYPKINNQGSNTEHSRPPGGGGGSFYFHGMQAHEGTGAYRVQSNSTWFPFSLCFAKDFQTDAQYGNEELRQQGFFAPFLQCVYIQGSKENPTRFQPGGLPGQQLFVDGNPDNDYIGPGGEIPILIGGQGGGGGGTRLDSFNAGIWSADKIASPTLPGPPFYPFLAIGNIYWSPSLCDAKGGGGGGGGGSVLIRSYGDIRLTRMGHIDASGGKGLGGEIVGNSTYSGGGGGGSGGAIILEAAGDIVLEADPGHVTPGFVDASLEQGAALDVSGGFGFDAIDDPKDTFAAPKDTNRFTRSDGGQGGFGLIQLQAGGPLGAPQVEQGAFLFARQKAVIKLGGWNGGSATVDQKEHISWLINNPPPPINVLRYIDMLEYRNFKYETVEEGGTDGAVFFWFVLNGADPPLITPDGVVPPATYQLDTPMIDHYGRRVVREPVPESIMATYGGFSPTTFKESNFCPTCTPPAAGKYTDDPPGTLYLPSDEIPFSIYLNEPDGTPVKQDPAETNPYAEFSHEYTIDRLPVVPLDKPPPAIGTVSRGTSKWLDFNGVALRTRDATGVAPPLFPGIQGTYNALLGAIPPGKEAQIVLGSNVPNVPGDTPAHFVANTGLIPNFDPGLCPLQGSASPPFNDIKVDSPDYGIENAVTDNAQVTLEFQGAFAIRAGSSTPDPDTMTGWVSDLRDLSGYPLVRFRVSFDLGINESYPFGPDSKKPGVDRVRVRAAY